MIWISDLRTGPAAALQRSRREGPLLVSPAPASSVFLAAAGRVEATAVKSRSSLSPAGLDGGDGGGGADACAGGSGGAGRCAAGGDGRNGAGDCAGGSGDAGRGAGDCDGADACAGGGGGAGRDAAGGDGRNGAGDCAGGGDGRAGGASSFASDSNSRINLSLTNSCSTSIDLAAVYVFSTLACIWPTLAWPSISFRSDSILRGRLRVFPVASNNPLAVLAKTELRSMLPQ
jgi:hypothetical protein